MAKPTFHLAGFPVHVDPTFLLVAALLGSSLAAEPLLLVVWVAVVFVSVLWHELGHAVAFRRFGHGARISLHAFGGLTAPVGRSGPRAVGGHGAPIAITLAGPGAGFVLGAAVWLVARTALPPDVPTAVALAADQLVWVNIGWGVLNLLPVQPLDGGRVVAHLVDAIGRDGRLVSRAVSVVVAGGGAAVAATSGWWWPALVGGLLALDNGRSLWRRRRDDGRGERSGRRAGSGRDPDSG